MEETRPAGIVSERTCSAFVWLGSAFALLKLMFVQCQLYARTHHATSFHCKPCVRAKSVSQRHTHAREQTHTHRDGTIVSVVVDEQLGIPVLPSMNGSVGITMTSFIVPITFCASQAVLSAKPACMA